MILQDPAGGFTARVLTRDPRSNKAKALARLGAEIVPADLDDETSVRRAFEGAYGAFCVTFFWTHLSPEKEIAQATTMARAAKDSGVAHVIWSTLEDSRAWVPLGDSRMPTLRGRYKVPHFDGKAEANQAFSQLGVPTTFLLTSFYWDNFIHFGIGPHRRADGTLALTLPLGDAKLPGIAAEDIGRCAYGLFKKDGEFLGKTVGIAGEHLTGAQMALALSRALGCGVQYNSVSPETYRRLDVPNAEEQGNMFQFKRDFPEVFCGARDVELSRRLNPSLYTFARWLAENRTRMSIP